MKAKADKLRVAIHAELRKLGAQVDRNGAITVDGYYDADSGIDIKEKFSMFGFTSRRTGALEVIHKRLSGSRYVWPRHRGLTEPRGGFVPSRVAEIIFKALRECAEWQKQHDAREAAENAVRKRRLALAPAIARLSEEYPDARIEATEDACVEVTFRFDTVAEAQALLRKVQDHA